MSANGVVTIPPASPIIPTHSAMPPYSASDIRKRTHAVQEIMRGVMKEGTHYGTIPGTPKPSLWKAGAEVLCMTFRLAPLLESHVTVDDPEAEWGYQSFKRDGSIVSGTCIGFFEVEAVCTIHSMNGEILSRCSARCNNREARYRSLSLFDIRNTILKMAEKRAFVSAVLMATGASDIFTQDMEDFPELMEGHSTSSYGEVVDVRVAVPPSTGTAKSTSKPASKIGQGLTPKREAWLFRAAQEVNLPKEILEKCLEHLRSAAPEVVKGFFDDLSRHKPVFQPFMAATA